jgi:hypothetical protein
MPHPKYWQSPVSSSKLVGDWGGVGDSIDDGDDDDDDDDEAGSDDCSSCRCSCRDPSSLSRGNDGHKCLMGWQVAS